MRQFIQRVIGSEKVRFVAVGAVNTTVDFALLFVLSRLFGIPIIVANIFSTSAALLTSFILNRRAVFKDTDRANLKQVALFVGVTLSGIWILQGVAILFLTRMLQGSFGVDATAALFTAKLLATALSVTWNYMWYSRVVFAKRVVGKK